MVFHTRLSSVMARISIKCRNFGRAPDVSVTTSTLALVSAVALALALSIVELSKKIKKHRVIKSISVPIDVSMQRKDYAAGRRKPYN
ncbi:hypothetical protein Naga_100858g2 [Nannochloropsis gaditana]|uniref:Uncharacterized protein n=1 Tax=Nannochloropsis gaditana TaxID=72520 RepID=W7SZL0_9STRA|nr:hypothetical protein Naga_100858g2 [Nannochloropsis gaditana]